jgi:hypothetical protein
MIGAPPVVPELDVADLGRSLAAYEGVLGFRCLVTRPEDRFAYLVHEGAHLMLQEAAGPGRRFRTAPLAFLFGRSVNLQIEVSDVDALHATVTRSDLADGLHQDGSAIQGGTAGRGPMPAFSGLGVGSTCTTS